MEARGKIHIRLFVELFRLNGTGTNVFVFFLRAIYFEGHSFYSYIFSKNNLTLIVVELAKFQQ